MTVCVAACAKDDNAIVLISDKMVSLSGREIDMQADTGICKLVRLGHSPWYAMLSGEISFAEDVVRHASQTLTDDPKAGRDVIALSGCVTRAFAKLWKERMIAQVLTPKLLSEELFLQRPRRLLSLPDSFANPVTEEINKFWIDCDLLVCGFDVAGKPHIVQIKSPGTASTHDTMGYWAVGAGADVAIGRLMWKETKRTFPLDRVLYEAFEAKATAELIQGVGYYWDAHILLKGKESIVAVPEDICDKMNTAFNFANNNWPPYDPIDEEDWPTSDWREQVQHYAESVMKQERERKRGNKQRKKKVKK